MIGSEIETVKGLKTETYSSCALCGDWESSGKMQGAEMAWSAGGAGPSDLCEILFAERI